ncbi:helix-turn-helix transcriptional regulator [Microbacterium sp. YJN-G]|uniref:helix-turn-helix transcriptional regulator n=1 Tax=Microbacterium sp. YJN-G TaxID=2763257 RepID=UPI00187888B6|nr:AraC family transcriptional regulator [Microbacterium sp. YJN-G]
MADFVRVDSRDVADVEELWSQYVPSARIEKIDPQRFAFQWRSAQSGGLSVVRYALSATVNSAVRPEDQILACRVSTPSGWVRGARSSLDVEQPWATDGAQVEAYWEGTAEVSAFIFDRSIAEQLARRITGDDMLRIRLADVTPRSDVAARNWNRSFDYVLNAMAAGEDDELIEAGLVRHALVTTLSTFHSTFLDAAMREPRFAGTSVVRRAVAYMDEHAQEPITLEDVAEAAHISTRGLQYAFRRALDTTPTEYLRKVRLDGAHRELQTAEPGSSVTEIARRWGFGNPSRFTTTYRQVYGRHPRATLDGE